MPRSSAPRPTALRPLRALAHPAWWVALALLAANDHLFKGAGVLPGALTGKLSDFAGLLVAPILFAALLGVRRRRGFWLAHLAVGAGFAAINLSPAIARMVEAATLPTPFPWFITVDPTDLVALPTLWVSAWLFGRWCSRPVAVRPAVARLGVALGGVACVATSPPPETPPQQFDGGPPPVEGETFSTANAHAALLNLGDGPIVVRTRALRPDVAVDCDAVAEDPTGHFTPDLFDAPVLWNLAPDTLLGSTQIDPRDGRQCTVALVATPDSQRLLFIERGRGSRQLRHVVGRSVVDGAIIALRDAEGARFDDHAMLFNAPTADDDAPIPACAGPAPGAGLAWTVPPMASGFVVGHSVGPDGCHAIDLVSGRLEGRWYVCAPGADFELTVDEAIRLTSSVTDDREHVRITTDDHIIDLVRGLSPHGFGLSLAAPEDEEACGAIWRDACDGVMRPLEVRDAEGPLPLGVPTLSNGATVTVIRAERALVSDATCDPWGGVIDSRVELVIDRPLAPAMPSEDAR